MSIVGVQVFTKYIGWHLELSRRCPLKCPACPRTYEYDLIENPTADLPKEWLFNFFPKDYLRDIQYIFFQGNLGDPIYHPHFHEISEYFFPVKDLAVITNGHKNILFWERVLETWPETSTICLSIDGIGDINSVYRVNSNWGKIEALFELISKKKRQCKIEWKFLVFEHNFHQIQEAEVLSKKIGIDRFRIQKSRPLDSRTNRNGLIKEYWEDSFLKSTIIEYLDEIAPFCSTGDMHYIDASGNYFPCCWWPQTSDKKNRKNSLWPMMSIKDHNMNSVEVEFRKFLEPLKKFECAPDICKQYCRKINDNKKEYLTPNSQLNRQIKIV